MSKWWNPTRALGRNASELVWRLPSCPWRGEKIEAITPRDNADSLKSVDCRLDRQSAAAILPLSKIGRPLFPICPVVVMMPAPEPFTDIHCHLLPGLDDGPQDLATALAMARLAARDGTRVVIVTPHQLGRYTSNRGAAIRDQTGLLQQALDEHGIPLRLLPGADVRIDDRLVALVQQGEVLSLADHGRHVLVELPHELYLPLEPLIEQLAAAGLVAILSHPERNRGILARPDVVAGLVDAGCLMQVTAGSLTGQFGRSVQGLAEVLIAGGLVQFVGSDAHATRDRAPVLRPAFDRVAAHTDYQTAIDLLCRNPALVARGQPVPAGRRRVPAKTPTWWGWRRHSAADGTLAAASGPR